MFGATSTPGSSSASPNGSRIPGNIPRSVFEGGNKKSPSSELLPPMTGERPSSLHDAERLAKLREKHTNPSMGANNRRSPMSNPLEQPESSSAGSEGGGFVRLIKYILPDWLLSGVENFFKKFGINLNLVSPSDKKPNIPNMAPTPEHGALTAARNNRKRKLQFDAENDAAAAKSREVGKNPANNDVLRHKQPQKFHNENSNSIGA